MPNFVFWNHEFVPQDRARVSVMDAGFLHGVGLFETMRAQNRAVFRIDQHLARMKNSADTLHLTLPDTFDELPRHAHQLLQQNALTEARLRLTITPGHSNQSGDPSLLLFTAPLAPYPPEFYANGVTVRLSSSRQNPQSSISRHKTISYYDRLTALREAAAGSCTEGLWFTHDGALAEGCISNVFLVRDGRLRTPPLETPVLPGITRRAILELAAGQREVEQCRLTVDDLLDADEVFLTNVMMKVMPVCRVERKDIGNAKPGPVTRELARAFDELLERECRHASPTPS